MSAPLNQHIETGLRWSAFRQVVTALVSALGALAYTRFLRPEDLGAFGLAFIVFSGLVLLIEAPIRDSVVYFQEQSDRVPNAAFWLLAVLGTTAAVLVALIAQPLAQFYESSQAAGLTRLLVLAFVFEALAVVPGALLLKQFRFVAHETLKLAATLITLIGWVSLGLAGWGAWALAVPVVLSSAFWALSAGWAAKFRPSWPPERQALRDIFGYSRSIFGSKLLTFLKLNIDNAAVGRMGERSLGLYSFGEDQSGAAVVSVGIAVSQVTLPAMAAVQDEPDEQRRVFAEMLRLAATIATPMQVGMIILAELGIRVIFGEHWLPGVPVLQAYLVFRLVDTLNKICDSAMSAIGRPDVPFKVDLAQIPFFAAATWWGISVGQGIVGVAWALAATRLVAGLIYLTAALRVAGLKRRKVVRYLGPSSLAAVVMAAGVIWLQQSQAFNEIAGLMLSDFLASLVLLLSLSSAGTLIYALGVITIDRSGFLEVWHLALRVLRPRRSGSQ
jgi:PST family polysaccharide transporter